jgi:hypothetical protein
MKQAIFIILLFPLIGKSQSFEKVINNTFQIRPYSAVELHDGYVISSTDLEPGFSSGCSSLRKISRNGELVNEITLDSAKTMTVNHMFKIDNQHLFIANAYKRTDEDTIKASFRIINSDLVVVSEITVNLDYIPQDLNVIWIDINSCQLHSGKFIIAFSYAQPSLNTDMKGYVLYSIDSTFSTINYSHTITPVNYVSSAEELVSYPQQDSAILFFSGSARVINSNLEVLEYLGNEFSVFLPTGGRVGRPVSGFFLNNKLVYGGGSGLKIARHNYDLSQDTFVYVHNDVSNLMGAYYQPFSIHENHVYICGTQDYNSSLVYGTNSYLRLFKRDSLLNAVWHKQYKRYSGFYYYAWNILATSDGGCLIAATRNNYTTMGEKLDLYLLKVDSLGNYTPMVGLENPTNTPQTLVYPNPGTSTLTIETTEGTAGNTFRMYNSTGMLMLQHRLQTETETIDASNLPAGIYIYETQNHNGEVERGKWVKME